MADALSMQVSSAHASERTLLEQLGGRQALFKIIDAFYDKVYAHPWFSKFFVGVAQERISNQQTDFMQGVFGGPKVYMGKSPVEAHAHIHITLESFEMRQSMLRETLEECKVPPHIVTKWIGLDDAFRGRMIKALSECEPRPWSHPIVSVPPMSKT